MARAVLNGLAVTGPATVIGLIQGTTNFWASGDASICYFGSTADVSIYRGGADILKTDDLLDASTAGLRTKHESAATPTGGNSGELRVGTDKLWVQDAGTWKSTAISAAGAPSFASSVKWGTD